MEIQIQASTEPLDGVERPVLSGNTYRARWDAKLAWHRNEGILPHADGGGPNGTLIVTQDDERGGVDSSRIVKLIREIIQGR